MGRIGDPETCMLVLGILSRDEAVWDRARHGLERDFGKLNRGIVSFPFDFTGYYRDEMGEELTRKFVTFDRLIDPGGLADIKHVTNSIEEETGRMLDGRMRRSINLDPGTISLHNLVLASTKHAFHRVYLSGGIYAELTLIYTHGSFRPLEWTYPDYRTPTVIEFFNSGREVLLERRKNNPSGRFHCGNREVTGQ